jgi:hypothetical protein
MEGKDDDHGELSQGNKRHHWSINENLCHNLLSLLLLQSLPKEYQLFRKSLAGNDLLPSFSNLKSKLLDEEMQIKMDA